MPGFRNYGEVAAAIDAGRVHTAHFRKIPSQASTANAWVDLSMASGQPVPNFYAGAPLAATPLVGFKGIFHGDAKAPAKKFVFDVLAGTPTAAMLGHYRLMDYLTFYAAIDGDAAGDVQDMDNTIPLPRYESGVGVRAMMVATSPMTGGGSFTYSYTNQDGVLRVSPTIPFNTVATPIASVPTGNPAIASMGGLFLPMVDGDTGTRSIVSTTIISPAGGLIAIALVRPLLSFALREINAPFEEEFFTEMPKRAVVEDGAYLGLAVCCAGSVAAGTLAGAINFIWS